MTGWTAILVAAVAVYSWKLFGYLVPKKLLESKVLNQLAGYLTIALLAGLVGVQTFVSKYGDAYMSIKFDERFASLLLAIVLLWLRLPFIVVVIAAGACAALLRLIF
jgi:branched-subunit amino acid transport protein